MAFLSDTSYLSLNQDPPKENEVNDNNKVVKDAQAVDQHNLVVTRWANFFTADWVIPGNFLPAVTLI